MDKVLSSGNSLTHSPGHSQCLGSHIIKNLSVLGSPADWSQRGLVLRHSFVRRMMKIGWVLDSHDPILLWFLKLLLTLELNIVKIECLFFALLPRRLPKTIYFNTKYLWNHIKLSRKRPLAQCHQVLCRCPIYIDGRELRCSMHRCCHTWFSMSSFIFCHYYVGGVVNGKGRAGGVAHRSSRAAPKCRQTPNRYSGRLELSIPNIQFYMLFLQIFTKGRCFSWNI